MEVLWKSIESENTHRTSKQHAYVPKMSAGGNKRNITLCGKFRQINEDGKAELFDKMDGELLLVADACKICMKAYERLSECEQEKSERNNAVLPLVSNSGNPLLRSKCDKCGRQILSWKNLGEASLYKNYDKDTFKYTGNVEQWVCNYCTVELGYDVD